LTAAELLNLLLLVHPFRVERDADAYACVVLYAPTLLLVVLLLAAWVALALNHQPAVASGN